MINPPNLFHSIDYKALILKVQNYGVLPLMSHRCFYLAHVFIFIYIVKKKQFSFLKHMES